MKGILFNRFNACRINLLAIYSSISRCVWRAFSLIIKFLSSIDLRVVIVCCSISCWLHDIMRFSNRCCRFARLAVILARFANAFARFNSCSCNFVIWFSTWLSCLVNLFCIFCNLSLSMSLYDLSWYCITLATNAPTNTEISATTAKVISRFSRFSVWMSMTFPCVV